MIQKLSSLIIFLTCSIAHGQISYIDSLTQRLQSTTDPLDRFEILDRIQLNRVGFQATNVDSAACIEMVQLAQSLSNDSLLAISYNWIGSYFSSNKGDNVTGLEYFYKALPYAMNSGDSRRISSIYFDISYAYFDLDNPEAALQSNLKGGQYIPPKTHPLHFFMKVQYQYNMTFYHVYSENADSARYYSIELKKTNEHVSSIVMTYNTLIGAATAEALLGNSERAGDLFNQASLIESQVRRYQSKKLYYQNYLKFLVLENRTDEAISQAKLALNLGTQTGYDPLKVVGASFLKQIYEGLNQIDSAYFYSKLESDINSLINSQANRTKIQSLAFSEELRLIEERNKEAIYRNQIRLYGLLVGIVVILVFAFILYRNNREKQAANTVLTKTLSDLKSTQSQLIQSEKMASLGELTAGIAHEIQNPLNFVNNFSEVNVELIEELQHELSQGNVDGVQELSVDIKENEEKISHHGKRADGIVKGMLQHSRTSSGVKEPTDVNVLLDEYLRLAYHGLRAKDKSFNANFKIELDEILPKIDIVPQDMGRVLLNLINNAFYACSEQSKRASADRSVSTYQPLVTVSTKKKEDKVLITVQDNGSGIPTEIKDKIFQPFFTTKPTGKGTGLGLSLSYDIVKAHGGELMVESKEGIGTTFQMKLPLMS